MRLSMLIGALALGLTMSSQVQSQDGYFRDDFTGNGLKPELSFLVEDRDRWTLVDNDYLMIVPRKWDGGTTNQLVYNGNLVDKFNFSISAKSIPSHTYFQIFVDINQDEDNYISLVYHIAYDRYNGPQRGITYTKKLKGEKSHYKYNGGVLNELSDLHLSIQRKGVEYVGYFSVDGANWISLGTHAFINFGGKPGFGARNSDNAPEAPVRIDYVEIRPID